MVTASGRSPRETEIEGNGSVVQLRSLPLVVNGMRTGALVLIRDVTELRHRERELMTKDATIREIHHRVKNNLQTVAALLRLQARRTRAPETREALEEAVRRVGSIAIVHETLSHTPEELVDFDDIAQRVAAMAGEVAAAEARVSPVVAGRFGLLPGAIATPLALVLTELLQNALQHGLVDGPGPAPAGVGAGAGGPRARAAQRVRGGQRGGPAGGVQPGRSCQPGTADRPDAGRVRTRRSAGHHAPAGRRHHGSGRPAGQGHCRRRFRPAETWSARIRAAAKTEPLPARQRLAKTESGSGHCSLAVQENSTCARGLCGAG